MCFDCAEGVGAVKYWSFYDEVGVPYSEDTALTRLEGMIVREVDWPFWVTAVELLYLGVVVVVVGAVIWSWFW